MHERKLIEDIVKDRQLLIGVLCAVALFSVAITVIHTYYVSNEREYFSLSNDVNNFMINVCEEKKTRNNLFYHFYFFNRDISLNI